MQKLKLAQSGDWASCVNPGDSTDLWHNGNWLSLEDWASFTSHWSEIAMHHTTRLERLDPAEITFYAVMWLFFLQLLSEFIEAIYTFGLLGTDVPPEIALGWPTWRARTTCC